MGMSLRIIFIDARNPTKISGEYDIPAAGPHGLDLDPATGRLMCACDAGALNPDNPTPGTVDMTNMARDAG
jgi:hypothetical protein